jgi:plastocyanin
MAPPQPYVNLQSGALVGSIESGDSFSWYNPTNGSCNVTGVGSWCTASSYNSIAAGASASATTLTGLTTGNYSFVCTCCQSAQPSVHVSAGHIPPGAPKRNR